MKSIGIIILNWQGWRDTLACLESLQALNCSMPISLIVCDNGSEDDSWHQILNWAQKHYSPSEMIVFSQQETNDPVQQGKNISHYTPFILIQTGRNLGFAGGNNVAIRYALGTKQYEYLWLLNNDTTVNVNALSHLYEQAKANPQIALLGSTVIEYFKPDRVQCAGGYRYFPLSTMIKPVFGGETVNIVMQAHQEMRLDYVYGAAMFLKVEAVEKVGLLNEEYFLFYEELDYSQRLKRAGYQIGWCQKSIVSHKGSASVGSIREGNREKLRQANYYENLNTLKYTANFHGTLLPIVLFSRFIGKALVLIGRREFDLFRPLLKAYKDFFCQFFYKP
jgi:GT2 family glycosyltransferase